MVYVGMDGHGIGYVLMFVVLECNRLMLVVMECM